MRRLSLGLPCHLLPEGAGHECQTFHKLPHDPLQRHQRQYPRECSATAETGKAVMSTNISLTSWNRSTPPVLAFASSR